MADSAQFELSLPPRSVDELLHDQLAAAVEASNAAVGEERAKIHRDVMRLRALLKKGGGG